MADIRTFGARARASASPAPGTSRPDSIDVLQTLATSAMRESIALLEAVPVSARQLERAMVKATRASTMLKRARAAQAEGGAA